MNLWVGHESGTHTNTQGKVYMPLRHFMAGRKKQKLENVKDYAPNHMLASKEGSFHNTKVRKESNSTQLKSLSVQQHLSL